jgi:hypothetical protein
MSARSSRRGITTRSPRAPREANSHVLLAHAMGEQVYALHDLSRLTDALSLVRGAQSLAKAGPDLLICWLRAVEGEIQAALADDECRRTLEHSAALLPAEPDDPRLTLIALDESHHARWRGHCLAQIGDAGAISHFTMALAQMDSAFVRTGAGLRCDMAQAFAARGKLDEVRQHLRGARLLANQVGSVRQRRRIRSISLAA